MAEQEMSQVYESETEGIYGLAGMLKMSGVVHCYALYFILGMHQNFRSVSSSTSAVLVSSICSSIRPLPFIYLACTNWSRILGVGGAYVQAAILIVVNYATLVVINTRYMSLVIIPIVMLVFIRALCINLSQKRGSSKDERRNGSSNAKKADEILVQMAVVPYWVLCCTGQFSLGNANVVVSQFLLFLSSALGVLTLMMARLPPSRVTPAVEVLRRASLVVVVLAAHSLAAELLGEDMVLVCIPELVAALLWLSTKLGSNTVLISRAASREGYALVMALVVCIVAAIGDWENLLSRYNNMTPSLPCAIAGILPAICEFALRQWRTQTTAATSSAELVGVIQLLASSRDISLVAAAVALVFKPLIVHLEAAWSATYELESDINVLVVLISVVMAVIMLLLLTGPARPARAVNTEARRAIQNLV